jgi:uncharacterized protein (TIGR02996 family)
VPYKPSCEAEAQLIAGLRANPLDDDLRAVYADWLEANGHPTRAQFLRAETEAARPGVELVVRLDLLAPRPEHAWRAVVARATISRCDGFTRALSCPGRWDALRPDLGDDTVRHCDTCMRTVPYCISDAAAKRAGKTRAPIALDAAVGRDRALAAYDGPIRWNPNPIDDDDLLDD